MYQELTGAVPKLDVSYARTLVNRAVKDVYRQNLWSFQLFEANWVSPNLLNTGTCSVTQGLTQVSFDATASAAIITASTVGPFPTPIIQRQFRIGNSTIYNIWAISVSGGIVTLTLDRPYTDVTAIGSTYMIYQIYYPAPMADFKAWIVVRDIVNFNNLILTKTRSDVDLVDPQRTIFYLPTWCVFYQQDQNPASSTYRNSVFELWGGILYPITYQLYGLRKGLPLVADTDTLPDAVGEDCVLALARSYAYEWAEANKGDMPRNAGSNFQFLMAAARDEYKSLYKSYRRDDREKVENWNTVIRHYSEFSNVQGFYNSIGGTASAGAPWLAILAAGLGACHALYSTFLSGAASLFLN